MVKIGFDAKRLFQNVSGLGNYSRNTVNMLSSHYKNDQFHLFTPEKGEEINYALGDNVFEHSPDGHWNFGVLKSVWHSYGILNDLKNIGVDIFHGLTNEMPLNKPDKSIRTVVTIHDLVFATHPEYYNPVDKVIYDASIRNSARNSDLLIAVSQKTKDSLINHFHIDEKKIKVVYQSCDQNFFASITEDAKEAIRLKYNLPSEFILSVGTIEKRKNLLAVLQAVKQAKIDMPLVIIGQPTKYLDALIEYISKHDLKRQVVLLHSVNHDELPSIYQMCSLFMYVSKVEGFGIPVVEALASRVPIITSKGTAMEEAAGTGALYVDPNNVDDISAGMLKLLQDSELRNSLVQNQAKELLRYQEETIVTDLFGVYKELL